MVSTWTSNVGRLLDGLALFPKVMWQIGVERPKMRAMPWGVLCAFLIYAAVWWIAKRAHEWLKHSQSENAKGIRKEQHLEHRNQQWFRAYQNREGRRKVYEQRTY